MSCWHSICNWIDIRMQEYRTCSWCLWVEVRALPCVQNCLLLSSPLSMSTVHTLIVLTWKPKEFHNAVTQCLLRINSVKCINHIKHGLLISFVERIFPPELEHCAQMPSTSQGRLTKLIQVCFLRAVEHYVFLCLPKSHPIFKITFFSLHFRLYLLSM